MGGGYSVKNAGMKSAWEELDGAGDDAGKIGTAISSTMCYTTETLGGSDAGPAFNRYAAAYTDEVATIEAALHELSKKVKAAKGTYSGTDHGIGTRTNSIDTQGGQGVTTQSAPAGSSGIQHPIHQVPPGQRTPLEGGIQHPIHQVPPGQRTPLDRSTTHEFAPPTAQDRARTEDTLRNPGGLARDPGFQSPEIVTMSATSGPSNAAAVEHDGNATIPAPGTSASSPMPVYEEPVTTGPVHEERPSFAQNPPVGTDPTPGERPSALSEY